MTLQFWQIYFKDEQLPTLYPFATPYNNEGKLTGYFENSVIAELVPQSTADLIGVCSWRLKEKRNESSTPFILSKRAGGVDLTEERILSTPFDVAVLTPRNDHHKPLLNASQWYGKAWVDAFVVFKRWLRSDLNIKVPDELTTAIYENHFIAKRDIYQSYVRDCLVPALAFVASDPVFMADSGYGKRIGARRLIEYQNKTGRKDYMIAPFILERLFSIWIEGKGFLTIPL